MHIPVAAGSVIAATLLVGASIIGTRDGDAIWCNHKPRVEHRATSSNTNITPPLNTDYRLNELRNRVPDIASGTISDMFYKVQF